MARKLNSTDGFILHGWMVTQLHLSGGELTAYALVHQFSQSQAGRYAGGPGYLAAWMGCTENSARKYLHALWERGLIVAEDEEINGVLFRNYRVSEDPLQNFEYPPKNLGDPLKNLEVENNKENNINISISPKAPARFDFRAALLGLGVTPEVADAWLLVRKQKKAVNTEIAFAAIEKEIGKTASSPDDCIRYAVEHSWSGFRADWCEQATARGPLPAKRKSDGFGRMLDVGRELGVIGGPNYE